MLIVPLLYATKLMIRGRCFGRPVAGLDAPAGRQGYPESAGRGHCESAQIQGVHPPG